MDNSDPEKSQTAVITATGSTINTEGTVVEKHRVTTKVDNLDQVEASTGWFSSLVKAASSMRVEERGIERVREEDRVKQSVFDGYTIWASANFTYVMVPQIGKLHMAIYDANRTLECQSIHLRDRHAGPNLRARLLGFFRSHRANQLLRLIRGRAVWLLRAHHRTSHDVGRPLCIWHLGY